MPASNISKGVLSVGMWTITRVIASILATPFISRALGPDGYGLYAYYLSVLFLAAPLANVGTLQALSRYIAEHPDPDRRARIALMSGLMCLGGIVVVGTLTACILAPGIPADHGWPLLVTLLACLSFDVLWFYARGILYGLHREELAGVAGAIAAVLTSCISAVLAVNGFGIMGVFIGLLLGNAFMAFRTLFAARRLLPHATLRDALTSTDPTPRELIAFTLKTMMYASLAMMLYRSGVVLVHHLTGENTPTGLFATALQMAEFVWVLVIAVEGVMLQSTARPWREGRTEEISALVSRVMRYVALVTGFLLTYVFVFAEELLAIYFGPAFAGAAPVLRILIPGVFSFSLGRLLAPVLHAQGRVLTLAAVVGLATLLNAILAFLLVPSWGLGGAGLSTCLAYGTVLFPYVHLLRSSGVEPLREFGLFRQLLLFVITGLVMASTLFIPGGPFLHAATGGILGAVVFVMVMMRSRIMHVEELDTIMESLPSSLSGPGRSAFGRIRPFLRACEGGGNRDA